MKAKRKIKKTKGERKLSLLDRINRIARRIYQKASNGGHCPLNSTYFATNHPKKAKAINCLRNIGNCHRDAELVPTLRVFIDQHAARQVA